jgi:hypothetical protein
MVVGCQGSHIFYTTGSQMAVTEENHLVSQQRFKPMYFNWINLCLYEYVKLRLLNAIIILTILITNKLRGS